MYVVDESIEQFEFSVGGKKFSLTAFSSLPFDEYLALADEVADKSNVQVIKTVVDHIEKHAPGSTKGLTTKQADSLVAAYLKGASLGE